MSLTKSYHISENEDFNNWFNFKLFLVFYMYLKYKSWEYKQQLLWIWPIIYLPRQKWEVFILHYFNHLKTWIRNNNKPLYAAKNIMT